MPEHLTPRRLDAPPAAARSPLRIGVVLENLDRSPDDPVFRGMALRVAEANAGGGVAGHGVELVFERADGAHRGAPENCRPAWAALAADPAVVGIVGPGISDNCLSLLADVQAGQVPTVHWCGADDARGEWSFQFQWGSLPDESDFLADLLGSLGHRRVAVLRAGLVGERYAAAFAERADAAGIVVAASRAVRVDADDVVAEVAELQATVPDALVFLGMGRPTLSVGRATATLGWQVPRFANIAMLTAALAPDAAARDEGVVWVDQYDPGKALVRRIHEAHRRVYGEPAPATGHLGVGYDILTLLLAGLGRAPELTRAGLRAGLERVRNVPAATGGAGSIMGFGPWDRAALKGRDMFLLRTLRGGSAVPFPTPGTHLPEPGPCRETA